ncbi:MAG TPA: Smr/MutS family protein [Bacteroidales bacterium]|nr:Smr/MutS family protein [Bacteroidales bacterium]
MIYPASFEIKTGFNQVRELVKDHCLFSRGKQKTDEISFTSNYEELRKILEETAEFKEICLFEENFPTDNYRDLIPALKKAKVEGTYLEVEEVSDLKKSLETIKAIIRFFKNTPAEKYTRLKKLAGDVKYFSYIDDRIDAILNKQGKIKDNASSGLRKIREDIAQKQASAGKRLQSLLKRAIDEGIVEKDTAISIRNGRQVIPVPASNKRKISGIVHDESATGRTAFVEPGEVVELNNEIRELEIEEIREIIRILILFTNDIRPYAEDLATTYDFLGTIDFIRAKALFALDINAGMPALINSTGFRWKQAVHPLLFLHHKKEGKPVVPLDIYLEEKSRILLISGPNAGGKSVCLKTVGLVQYMLQCGLLIPVVESSEAGIFNDILIDIGDEQSIENDLSTYSSHLQNMKNFLRNASSKSLILIDEFGTGTEPQIGGAMAEAILESLNNKGTYGVITTHYSNLKHFASDAPGITNGAMMFDTGKMQPLFKLEIGKPGSSFAIDIARQIGLPEDILKSASDKAGEDHINFDKHLREILRDKRYWEEKRDRIRIAEKRLGGMLEQYEQELGETKKLRREILDNAKREAENLLMNTNKEIEKTIRVIKESQAEKEITREARKGLDNYKKELPENKSTGDNKLDQKIEQVTMHVKKYRSAAQSEPNEKENVEKDLPLAAGDRVKILSLQVDGEVLEINGDNVLVTYGQSMITTVKATNIQKLPRVKSKQVKASQFDWSISQRKLNFKNEIDIRGKRGDEAVDIVRNFVDDATIVGVSELRILHGKGNGILKSLVRDYLKSLDVVRSCKDEHVERGGSGITVVQLDF